jgi:hypothetical protein
MTRFYVTAPKPRPDFRLAIVFLWHDGQNVDTDGDCEYPASHDWTELYIANRERPTEPSVSVSAHQQSPLILAVESESEHLAARVAYFLAVSVGSSPERFLSHVGDFDVEAALKRAAESPFSRATREHPYPNLDRV